MTEESEYLIERGMGYRNCMVVNILLVSLHTFIQMGTTKSLENLNDQTFHKMQIICIVKENPVNIIYLDSNYIDHTTSFLIHI